jgi:hypothetical protein
MHGLSETPSVGRPASTNLYIDEGLEASLGCCAVVVGVELWLVRRKQRRRLLAAVKGSPTHHTSGGPSKAESHRVERSRSPAPPLTPPSNSDHRVYIKNIASPLQGGDSISSAEVTSADAAAKAYQSTEPSSTLLPASGASSSLHDAHRKALSQPSAAKMSTLFNTIQSFGSHEEGGKVYAARATVATAVLQMQAELQEELQDDQLQIFSVLGRGGFGTVYHGAAPCSSFCRFRCWGMMDEAMLGRAAG